MAVIAIFCDGTWSRFDDGERTHVAHLAAACAENQAQKVLYFEGVGTGTGMISDIGRWFSKIGGGLFGWGLNRNIKAAYLGLCKTYQPGDKIMIFGFSRGAYTARSLVGMIRKCGILSDPCEQNLELAFSLYRARGARNAPDAPRVWAARRRLSPDYATSAKDVMHRKDQSYLVRITYLGVWDTVGALGMPPSILGGIATLWNKRYAFHDTSLSHLVEHARHAVSLDEKRVLFAPSLWGNLESGPTGSGLNGTNTSDTRYYQQMWFAGNHGIIGGSTPPKGLAAASLGWIWAGAQQAGLSLKPNKRIPNVLVDTVGPAPALYDVNKIYRLFPWLLKWRNGPSETYNLHPTARMRAAFVSEYRPKSLKISLPGLFRRK
ncbi:MAG: DUF2235 domain-containing protein [Roseobacter sp.]